MRKKEGRVQKRGLNWSTLNLLASFKVGVTQTRKPLSSIQFRRTFLRGS